MKPDQLTLYPLFDSHFHIIDRRFHELAEHGVRIKATGFGRVDFDVSMALKELYAANPKVLMSALYARTTALQG